jgi:tetratricopeptide (TPR) repeat protein
MPAGAAQTFVGRVLIEALASRTVLVVVENLDALFETLGKEGQHSLRAFIQENPRMTIVATAQRLVEDLSSRAKPFFGFFQTEYLKPLNLAEATELLRNIARMNRKRDVVEFLDTRRGRSRIRALHHLSGGNHRIYIVLSHFITKDSIDALVGPFMKMVDELTPYYQERIRWLSPLQRRIVELLCRCEGPVPVKELAKRLFGSQQTISRQLQELREKGYVEANARGREMLYEVSEPLMRICVEVKENSVPRPLRLLVDFLRAWYEDSELTDRLLDAEPMCVARTYLESALDRNREVGSLRKDLLMEDYQQTLQPQVAADDLKDLSTCLAALPESALLALQCWAEGREEEGNAEWKRAIERELDGAGAGHLVRRTSSALLKEGVALYRKVDYSAAATRFNRVINIAEGQLDQFASAIRLRGLCFYFTGETGAARADWTRVIEMKGSPPQEVARSLFHRGFVRSDSTLVEERGEDWRRLIQMDAVQVWELSWALVNVGIVHWDKEELQAAEACWTRAIELRDAPGDAVSLALSYLCQLYQKTKALGSFEAAKHRLLEMTNAAAQALGRLWLCLGVGLLESGDFRSARVEFTRVIDHPGMPADLVVSAYVHRASCRRIEGNLRAATEECAAALAVVGPGPEQMANALSNRAFLLGEIGDLEAARDDCTRIIELQNVPVNQVLWALDHRGHLHQRLGNLAGAIQDWTRVLEMPGASPQGIADALLKRADCHEAAGEDGLAQADYSRVIELQGVSVEQLAFALVSRGLGRTKGGDLDGALADYTRAIDLPEVPSEQLASALFHRRFLFVRIRDWASAEADETRLVGLAGVPAGLAYVVLMSKSFAHAVGGDLDEARENCMRVINLPDARPFMMVHAFLRLTEIAWSQGQWQEGFSSLGTALDRGSKADPKTFGSCVDLASVLFSAGLSPTARQVQVAEMIRTYARYQALPSLGEGLIRHIGKLFQKGAPFPSSDNLVQWQRAWEQGAAGEVDFQLPLRLLRVGIAFVSTGGTDPTVLLELAAAERSILRQALGLEETE